MMSEVSQLRIAIPLELLNDLAEDGVFTLMIYPSRVCEDHCLATIDCNVCGRARTNLPDPLVNHVKEDLRNDHGLSQEMLIGQSPRFASHLVND